MRRLSHKWTKISKANAKIVLVFSGLFILFYILAHYLPVGFDWEIFFSKGNIPVFVAEIISDQPTDGDIAFDPVLQSYTITQGPDTVFFGIDDSDPNLPEYRAFLDFPSRRIYWRGRHSCQRGDRFRDP